MADQANEPDPEEVARQAVEAAQEKQRQAARAWVEEKWTQPKACPICGTNSWLFTEAGSIDTLNAGSVQPMGRLTGVWPIFMVLCRNCAYTMFFNAIFAGVVPADNPDAP